LTQVEQSDEPTAQLQAINDI